MRKHNWHQRHLSLLQQWWIVEDCGTVTQRLQIPCSVPGRQRGKLCGSSCSIRVFGWISAEAALGHIMSRAEITEERLKLTASQSRCRSITNHTILCISARTAAEHTNVCRAVTKGYAYAYLCPLIHGREECSVMPGRKSIQLLEEEGKHKELDLTVMNGARLGVIMRLMLPDTSCEDCLLAIFSFLSERHWCATEISQTHAKHLCHIINLSQGFLCNTKDTSSSVLISVAYSVFLLHRQRLHRHCSSGDLFCVRAN